MASVTMKAIANDRYGPPEHLRLEDRPVPAVEPDFVLVRVRAASINPYDWHQVRGTPLIVRLVVGMRGPHPAIPGLDVAGVVEDVGADVTEFRPGDEVIGSCSATFAEFARARQRNIVLKPGFLSFEQAAALPGAGVTALQAVRAARVGTDSRVLINGASGGVGTYAVQIAKSLGAHVTGVCSSANADLVRSLGADAVVDYTREDFTRGSAKYDVVLDNVGNHSLRRLGRTVTPDGVVVAVGGGGGRLGRRLVGGLGRKVLARLHTKLGGREMIGFRASVTKDDLAALVALVADGAVTPVIDRTYSLEEVPAAIRYVEAGHARGKAVIVVA
jgi:NADPH:quinone reductase-like Zn-dependent oxidoreductase